MKDSFTTTKFLLDRIQKLYPTFQRPDEIDIELWTEVLQGYSQTDILDALKAYRRETEYNKAPNPAEFKKFLGNVSQDGMRERIMKCAEDLEAKYGVRARNIYIRGLTNNYGVELKLESKIDADVKSGQVDYATAFMQRDISLKRNRHLLTVYQKTVSYVVGDLLSKEIPVHVWRSMDRAKRCEEAMKRGLFNEFDELLVKISRKYWGKDYQYLNEAVAGESSKPNFDLKAASLRLASHFRQAERQEAAENDSGLEISGVYGF